MDPFSAHQELYQYVGDICVSPLAKWCKFQTLTRYTSTVSTSGAFGSFRRRRASRQAYFKPTSSALIFSQSQSPFHEQEISTIWGRSRVHDLVLKLIAPLERWTEKEKTRAEVEVLILDHVFQHRLLPTKINEAWLEKSINTFGPKA